MGINKKKIINDPVFGFIKLESDLIFDIIEHPYFQRLRRIKQLGLTNIVFPGANHTRFEHALGCVYLMRSAISNLRHKGVEITEEESEAVSATILLHDIGHGPFSHTLEKSIVEVSHEDISDFFIAELNRQFNGKLTLANKIFRNKYHKKFLHQLVSSQLDVDRLDYLRRDSFYTGVIEGSVGSDRIIKMMNVYNDMIVVEGKGIYSVEDFLMSRRLMYWQVYLHKTVLVADQILLNILKRARELTGRGVLVPAPFVLSVFLHNKIESDGFLSEEESTGRSYLSIFAELDDNDIITSVKEWQYHDDFILSFLSRCLIRRRLFKVVFKKDPIDENFIAEVKKKIISSFHVGEEDLNYFLMMNFVENATYSMKEDKIYVQFKSGDVKELSDVSDINLANMSRTERKYYVCYPKELDIN